MCFVLTISVELELSTNLSHKTRLTMTTKQGWLTKQPAAIGRAHRRFFVATRPPAGSAAGGSVQVQYFEDDTQRVRKGTFDTKSVQTVTDQDRVGLFGFAVDSTVRRFVLYASSASEREEWIGFLSGGCCVCVYITHQLTTPRHVQQLLILPRCCRLGHPHQSHSQQLPLPLRLLLLLLPNLQLRQHHCHHPMLLLLLFRPLCAFHRHRSRLLVATFPPTMSHQPTLQHQL